MSRFEVTFTGGETLLVEHEAASVDELSAAVDNNRFILLAEARPGSPSLSNVLVATSQILIVRSRADGHNQGSNFRPKR